MATKPKNQDPRQMYPRPPFPAQKQEFPGYEYKMKPLPDFGKETYQGHGRLKDKVAVITGGDSGIGRAVAVAYAREGADVLISYLSEDRDAATTKQVVEESGQKCLAIPGDIQSEAHCQTIIKTAVDQLGGVDILVNNAAYQMSYESIQEITYEELERTFATNVYAMFYLCKAALPHMKPGSSIINTASIQAYNPSPSLLAYAPTKAVIVNFTKAFMTEAMRCGVRVNAVAPGPIWTPLIPYSFPGHKSINFGQDTPMQRAGQPAELAPVFVFLASNESSYVTGHVYGVTGGEGWP